MWRRCDTVDVTQALVIEILHQNLSAVYYAVFDLQCMAPLCALQRKRGGGVPAALAALAARAATADLRAVPPCAAGFLLDGFARQPSYQLLADRVCASLEVRATEASFHTRARARARFQIVAFPYFPEALSISSVSDRSSFLTFMKLPAYLCRSRIDSSLPSLIAAMAFWGLLLLWAVASQPPPGPCNPYRELLSLLSTDGYHNRIIS